MDTLSQTISEAQDRRIPDKLDRGNVVSLEEIATAPIVLICRHCQYAQAVEHSVCSRCQGAI